jgi:hypothetical protein
MKTKLATFGCLMFVSVAAVASLASGHTRQAVEHAPTVEQCRADLKTWWEKAGKIQGLDDITYDVLGSMSSEMTNCIFVDKANRSQAASAPDYYEVTVELDKQQAQRVSRFLTRHELWQKFSEEDAAGKR